jgi:GDP-L-fucose synthase
MEFEDKKIFVAGASGLAGASIIQHILGNCPSTRIRGTYLSTQPFLKDERIEFVQADLRHKEDCRLAMRGCDLAVMAAANTAGARAAHDQPQLQMTDNLVMDANLLEACYAENVPRVIFISSASVYQEFEGHIKEKQLDWNQDPHPAYFGVGWVKRAIEKQCQFWHDKFGQEIVVLRAANIYGPYAKFDPRQSNFIPALIRKAVERMDPFEVWGNPHVTRDVIFAPDFARAVCLFLAQENIKFDIYNLGTGKAVTVGDVAVKVLKCAGHAPKKIIYAGNEPTTIQFRALDCGKMKDAIGWTPATSLAEGLQSTTEWWIKNKSWWKK